MNAHPQARCEKVPGAKRCKIRSSTTASTTLVANSQFSRDFPENEMLRILWTKWLLDNTGPSYVCYGARVLDYCLF